MDPRPPEHDLERIATMQMAGLPFDLAVGMATDWQELENDIRVRALVGEYPTHRPIEKLALIVLAYYRPERLLGEELVDALAEHQESILARAGARDDGDPDNG